MASILQPGQMVRDYVIEQLIGEGGMGQVWRARHVNLDKLVALKIMSPALASDPAFEGRFRREAQAQAKLSHERIVGATDFFKEQGMCCLVMPYLEGQSLAHLMDRAKGPLTVEFALSVARDILPALDVAHQNGVIHRDVKPSNILMDRQQRAYLTDFGIALMLGEERKTRTGAAVGTAHYMSPEQIIRPRQMDHRADVYSFGVVMYELLAGRLPFDPKIEEGDIDFLVKQQHLVAPVPGIREFNPAIPPELEAVVVRSLAKEPQERYSGCGEFLHFLNNPPLLAPPPLPVTGQGARAATVVEPLMSQAGGRAAVGVATPYPTPYPQQGPMAPPAPAPTPTPSSAGMVGAMGYPTPQTSGGGPGSGTYPSAGTGGYPTPPAGPGMAPPGTGGPVGGTGAASGAGAVAGPVKKKGLPVMGMVLGVLAIALAAGGFFAYQQKKKADGVREALDAARRYLDRREFELSGQELDKVERAEGGNRDAKLLREQLASLKGRLGEARKQLDLCQNMVENRRWREAVGPCDRAQIEPETRQEGERLAGMVRQRLKEEVGGGAGSGAGAAAPAPQVSGRESYARAVAAVNREDYQGALREINAALAVEPGNAQYARMRKQILDTIAFTRQ